MYVEIHTFWYRKKETLTAGADAEMAFIKLSELFNHTSPMVTRRYLGLRQEELGEVYESLTF